MIKLKSVEQMTQGEHLSDYKLNYELPDGKTKVYEIVSRGGSKTGFQPALTKETLGKKSDIAGAVSLIVLNNTHDKVLVCKEFRLGINAWVYGFPGGLVDCGETLCQAAKRELKEETGLDLNTILSTLPASFTSAPVTDETINIIICTADGEIRPSDSPVEPIESQWMSKKELTQLLYKSDVRFTSRFQTFAYLWCHGL